MTTWATTAAGSLAQGVGCRAGDWVIRRLTNVAMEGKPHMANSGTEKNYHLPYELFRHASVVVPGMLLLEGRWQPNNERLQA